MIAFDSTSYWEKETYLKDINYLVLGSGIVGLSTAIHLKKERPNSKVVIIERGYIPTGASTKNAGFACIGSASELLDDLQHSSEEEVFITVQKRWEGLQYLKELIGSNNLEYQENGSFELFHSFEKGGYLECLDKLEWLNKHLQGIIGIEKVFRDDNEIIHRSGFNSFQYAISNAAEGQLNTAKMMQALIQKARELGVQLLNGIEVKNILPNYVETNYGSLAFEKLAICTNGLASQFLPNEDVNPARAQVIVTSPIDSLLFKGIYHFDKGYYYFRNIENRVLLGGGRNLDFKAEETDELNTSDYIINHLSELLESQILPNQSFTIDYQWAGTMGVGQTKAPIIKKINENHYCGVRLGGMGVAIGSLVGRELSAIILD